MPINERLIKEILYFIIVLSQEYLKSDTHGRSTDNTSILQVKQGCEPLNFTGYFLAWDTEKWSVSCQDII